MKKPIRTLFVILLLMSLASISHAQGDRRKWNPHVEKQQKTYYEHFKQHIHQKIVQYQLRSLKLKFDKSLPEARQLFLEYIGTTGSSNEEQIQALRDQYEHQIAELNASVASLQQSLDALPAQLNAQCDTRLAEAQLECQATTQQQLNDLNLAHENELADLGTQLNTACDDRLEQAYVEWQASSGCNPQDAVPPEQIGALSTGYSYPHAFDMDDSGNFFVLDRDALSVIQFDASGAQLSRWSSLTLNDPLDIAVDSNGSIYVIDSSASPPLQKFEANGAPLPFVSDSTIISSPLGLYIDSNDTIYVTDKRGDNGSRILKFDSQGNLLGTFGENPEMAALGHPEFTDVVVDENNQVVYVLAGSSNLIAKFDPSGNQLGLWEGLFMNANGIAVAENGDVLVADTDNYQVDQYDANGNYKFSFAEDIFLPYKVLVDANGKVYVTDTWNNQVKIYQ